MDACQEGTLAYAIAYADIHRKHIHTAQQLVVQLLTLIIVVALLPVTAHQLVVGLDGIQLF
jgi:hypothetical protein